MEVKNMKTISQLDFGFADAENYKRRENKDLFNKIFIRTDDLDKLLEPSKYFLIGEKGTGKTAFAVFLSNNEYKNTTSNLNYIREADYHKFITLKQKNHLELSDYANIWKVIILLLVSQKISRDEEKSLLDKYTKFAALQKAIDEYYAHAFSPEIMYALSFTEESKSAAEVLAKYVSISGAENQTVSFTENRFQMNLLYIQNTFERAISSLRLKRNHYLFIDGIDIRPHNVPYEHYLECIKGLANALWSLNNDFFPSIKASLGRIKVILLLRPDIFASLGLQNTNNKIRDNGVLLDWRTNYTSYENSSLFKLSDRLLSAQQIQHFPIGVCWAYYFPYQYGSTYERREHDSSFILMLRYSMWRPRDIITMMKILQEKHLKNGHADKVFRSKDFDSWDFKVSYSDYLLGEIKDHLSFYYTDSDYELFIKFFEFLKGKFNFEYEYFVNAYNEFVDFTKKNSMNIPIFFETPDSFLQFLYELNVLCYIETSTNGVTIFRWSFRERSYSNVSPKVKTNGIYQLHYGIQQGLGRIIFKGNNGRL